MCRKAKEVVLRVQNGYFQDAGRGIARVDLQAMLQLDLRTGDPVEIEGRSVVQAKAWAGDFDERGWGRLRLDAALREATGVDLDEEVRIRKVKAG